MTKRVWENRLLTEDTKMRVYQACVLSTLLYGSEAWTTYQRQEHRLNTFHMGCLGRILDIRWQDRIPNSDILTRAGIPSIFSVLIQWRLQVAGPCVTHGRWAHPKGHHVWEVCHRQQTSGAPSSLIQGCL